MRRFLASLTVAVALLVPLSATAATGQETGGQDNTAVAVNTKDGSSLFRFMFNITKVTGEVVDAGNAAVAYASCTECQTVAIAIQFVIVVGSPDVFTPENIALAMNVECSMCDTLASAYQFVIQTTGLVRLSPEGRRQIVALVQEVRDLADSGLTGPQIQAKLDAIADRMYEVMRTELVPIPADESATADSHGTTTTTTTEVITPSTTAPSTSTTTTARTTTTSAPVSTTTTSTSTTSSPTTTTSAP